MTRALALFIAALLIAGVVHARGGDGGDYSGDGSSSSSGSDYGSSSSSSSDYGSSSDYDYGSSSDYDYGDSDYGDGGGSWLDFLVVVVVVGLIIAASLGGSALKIRRQNKYVQHTRRQSRRSRRPDLGQLKRQDPNFSPVLFRAFAHLVYVKYHESRGGMTRRSAEEFAVAPFLSPELREIVKQADETIAQVIVGDMRIDKVSVDGQHTRIWVNFKSNVVYKDARGRLERMLLLEQLTFSRRAGVLTREPERILALGCPSCGTRQEPDIHGRCPSCGNISGDGRMDWEVVAVREEEPPRKVKGSVAGGGGPERGTDLPTVMDPEFKSSERALRMRDPEFTWSAFTERARTVFTKLQEGWTERDESILRPFELDHVFDTHRIWLGRYREEGVRNVLKDLRIEYIKPVKIEHDSWYDTIVARVRAGMIDYKESDTGRHLSGDTKKRKVFTEYLTFVRRSGRSSTKHEPFQCPQCGAPLDRVSQLGVCGYCDSRITTGEFDWVLAEIIQDEEYDG